MILDKARVASLLAMAAELGRERTLYDVHVSPYEVIFCDLAYRPHPEHAGLHSLEGARYRPPRAGSLRIEDVEATERKVSRAEVPSELSTMMTRRQYAHIGPRILGDHMALSGIARSLLIPVVRPGGDPEEQTRLMFAVYGGDPRFAFAYCPRGLDSAQQACAEVREVARRYPLRALKMNANIQGVDLASTPGRESLVNLLAACRDNRLPLIVHGGISRLLKHPEGRAYASLPQLASLPWGAAEVPVVISHAGLFGCSASEVEALLPTLLALLERCDNLLVDISGLSVTTLCAVLERVDPGRVVFGSDALYFPQWSAVVKVLYALERIGLPVQDTFATIAGTNPARHLFSQEPA
jgi:predicted TIM-barrel fold metal-dependent hydrolase